MRKVFRITDICRYAARIFLRKETEHIFITLLSGSQYHDLDPIIPKDFIHHIVHQIKTFLICQTGNHTDQEFVRIFLQACFFLKCKFICFFIGRNISGQFLCDCRIFLWIKHVVIQSVYDSGQCKRFCTHQSIQAFAAFGGLNFSGISLTDGCNVVRIHDTTF